MDYQEFINAIKYVVQKSASESYPSATISINDIPLNNGSVETTLCFTPAENCLTQQLNLEPMYQDYCNHQSMECTLAVIAQFVINAMKKPVVFNSEEVSDFQQAQDKVLLRVVNKDSNQEQLQFIPYREVENTDLIATYRIGVSVGGAEDSILVNNAMLDNWGVGEVDLYEKALKNTQQRHPFQMQSVENFIKAMILDTPVKLNQIPTQIEPYTPYILSNERRYNGAACLLYPGLLKEIGKAFDCNFFILPRSIHELILVKDTGEMSESELQRMTRAVDATLVIPEERLSDRVFSYNYQENSLSTATITGKMAEAFCLISGSYPMSSEYGMDEDMERE